mgnify:CR=1 FL=1
MRNASKQPILQPIWYWYGELELLARSHSRALGFLAITTFCFLLVLTVQIGSVLMRRSAI